MKDGNSSVSWIDRGVGARCPEDAVGYLAAEVERCDGVLVVLVKGDDYHTRAFGNVTVRDACTIAALLQHESAHMLYQVSHIEESE